MTNECIVTNTFSGYQVFKKKYYNNDTDWYDTNKQRAHKMQRKIDNKHNITSFI